MLQVTDSATAFVADQLQQANAPEETVIRITPEGNGLALNPGNVSDDDVTYEHQGRTVLAIPRPLAEQLDTLTLQTQETEQGTRLEIRQQEDAAGD
jgi:hypothetical protein